MKKIIFVLPGVKFNPVGGYKVAYEYANRLAKDNDVTIAYDCVPRGMRLGLPLGICKVLGYLHTILFFKYKPSWFSLNDKIKRIPIIGSKIPYSDVLIATAYITADKVLKNKAKKKLYLIQDYECWNGITKQQVEASYNYGFTNVVVSNWLKKIVDRAAPNNKAKLIENGISLEKFVVTRSIKARQEHTVAMLYHNAEHKGSKYGLAVISKLKEIFPDLRAHLFGSPERPSNLPAWILYTKMANEDELQHIYNGASVYIYPSINEGFGLTCVEAMACGCALCVTDYPGAREFAKDGITAEVSPVKDVDAMVKNVINLFKNDKLRIEIANAGCKFVQKYNWDAAERKLCEIINY